MNVLWGFFNFVIAYLLSCRVGEFDLHSTAHVGAFGLGALVMGLVLARTFGRLHGGNLAGEAKH